MRRLSLDATFHNVWKAFDENKPGWIVTVAESRCRFYFLQHKNLLREKVVIRATNSLNLPRNIVARQVARKCCPYYCAFNKQVAFRLS